MRPKHWLNASLALTVMTVLVSGCSAANRLPDLQPYPSRTTRSAHSPATVILPAATTVLVSGCCATHRLPDLEPHPTWVTQAARRPAGVMLPGGVQVTSDPNPHPTGTYRTPDWDPRTTAVAGLVVVGTHAVLIQAFQHVRVFPGR
jgi:hypothetical protein